MLIKPNKIVGFFYLFFFSFSSVVFTLETNVKVAVVHFSPHFGQISWNVDRLLHLAEEAGSNGAKIVVFPELATSGYSFFNRAQIRQIAEPIPGKTTLLFSEIAKKHDMYIVIGIPEYEISSNLFYNTAVLIDPNGEIAGVYRKHSHIMESSWSALGSGSVPVFNTKFGNLAILICADIHYAELSAQTIAKEAKSLILPTNGGINIDLLRTRAIEGQCHIILSNRYGNEKKEYCSSEVFDCFNEETFSLIPPFYYDFQEGKSLIVSAKGKVELILDNSHDAIGYCELPLNLIRTEIATRKPDVYALLAQNTLESYALKCMNLPSASVNLVAVFKLESKKSDELVLEIRYIFRGINENFSSSHNRPRLVVFPANILTESSLKVEPIIQSLKNLATEFGLDFVIGIREIEADRCASVSYFLTSDQKCFRYQKLHKRPSENINTGEHFMVVDRAYGRIAIFQDTDLLIPEASKVVGKMGVDIIAVSADEDDDLIRTFCKARSLDYLHIIMANKRGYSGIYAGGFRTFPSFKENKKFVITELDTAHVRDKKELKIGFDHQSILKTLH